MGPSRRRRCRCPVDCLLGLIYLGSTAAFSSFTGVATICLATSYGLPILVSVLRGRRDVQYASYSLGRRGVGFAINIVTLCWILLSIFLFCMPTVLDGLDASTMNYASAVFAGFASISMIWYFVWGRKHFTGPPVLASELNNRGVGVVSAHDPETASPSAPADEVDAKAEDAHVVKA